MLETVQTNQGAVRKGEKVTIENRENGSYRIQDTAGRIYYVPKGSVKIL